MDKTEHQAKLFFKNNVLYNNIHSCFSMFPMDRHVRSKEFFVNFLGGRVRQSYFKRLGNGDNQNKPYWNATLWTNRTPRYACSEDYYEWIDLLSSIISSTKSFNMLKLGCDTGRWEAFAALANHHYKQSPCHLVSVDVKRRRVKKDIQQVFIDNRINTFDEVTHTIVGKSVTAKNNRNEISLNGLIDYFDGDVDFIDCDIQGHEKYVFHAAVPLLNERVKRVHIGTHSKEIDEILGNLFTDMSWKNEHMFGCYGIENTPQGIIYFQDGIQTWVNPKIGM